MHFAMNPYRHQVLLAKGLEIFLAPNNDTAWTSKQEFYAQLGTTSHEDLQVSYKVN
jgi:hypothetical protein